MPGTRSRWQLENFDAGSSALEFPKTNYRNVAGDRLEYAANLGDRCVIRCAPTAHSVRQRAIFCQLPRDGNCTFEATTRSL